MTIDLYLTYGVMPILCIALFLTFIRFVKGPTFADRVVALDLCITIGVAIIGVFSLISQRSTFLDNAMILALIAFLGTIAFSYYLLKTRNND